MLMGAMRRIKEENGEEDVHIITDGLAHDGTVEEVWELLRSLKRAFVIEIGMEGLAKKATEEGVADRSVHVACIRPDKAEGLRDADKTVSWMYDVSRRAAQVRTCIIPVVYTVNKMREARNVQDPVATSCDVMIEGTRNIEEEGEMVRSKVEAVVAQSGLGEKYAKGVLELAANCPSGFATTMATGKNKNMRVLQEFEHGERRQMNKLVCSLCPEVLRRRSRTSDEGACLQFKNDSVQVPQGTAVYELAVPSTVRKAVAMSALQGWETRKRQRVATVGTESAVSNEARADA